MDRRLQNALVILFGISVPLIGIILLLIWLNPPARRRPNRNYPNDWEWRCKTVWRRDFFRCQECGRFLLTRGEVHHRVPLSRGGTHKLSNLELLCPDCHAEMPGHEHMRRYA